MDLHDAGHAGGLAFTVKLALEVEDVAALWNAAAERGLAHGMPLSDVLDTIGPREDPSIADCIAMLTAPGAIAGCALESFEVEEAARPAAAAPLLRGIAA